MKGLSLNQPYAGLVALGLKTLETRKTRIHYRGPLVICSTLNIDGDACSAINKRGIEWDCHVARLDDVLGDNWPRGQALALVDVVDCRELVPEDWPRSFFYAEKRFAWEFANVRRMKPFPVRGMNGLFPVDEEKVRVALGIAQLEAAQKYQAEARASAVEAQGPERGKR